MTNERVIRIAKKLLSQDIEQLWMRLGNMNDYEEFGDNFDSAAREASESGIDRVDSWIKRGGFTAFGFEERNYVSLYWGDDNADMIRPLNRQEQKKFEKALTRI